MLGSESTFTAGYSEILELRQRLAETEQALADTRRAFRQVLDAVHDPVAITRAGRLTYVNPAFAQTVGYSIEELRRERVLEPGSQDDGDGVEGERDYHLRLIRGDGRIVEIEGQPLCFVDIDGARGLLSVGRTTSEADEARRSLLESNLLGIVTLDVTGRLLEANDAFLAILGYTREDFLAGGLNWAGLSPPDEHHLDTWAQKAIRAQGLCPPFEKDLVRKDGARVPVLVGGSGSPERVTAFVLDVSDKRRAAEDLRRSNELLEIISRATNDAIWDWDLQADQIRWNENFSALFGYTPEQTGTTAVWWHEQIHPEDREKVLESIRAALNGPGELWSGEYRFRCAGGNYAHVLDRGLIMRGERGEAVRMIGAMMDVTERTLMQQRLQLADRMASVGTLAAGVAHEINNPLAYVVANIEYATAQIQDAAHEWMPTSGQEEDTVDLSPPLRDVMQALSEAQEGAERVRTIVRDLKLFSRVPDEQRGPVDVRKVMESSICIATNEIRHRAQVVRHFDEVPPVQANESRLGQVFLNLLINAAQAITEGAADKNQIHVSTRLATGGLVQIEVRDTGVGIPADRLGRIFDPFFTTKNPGEGTGLGLAICHGIVTTLGGRMEVDSTPGKGSCFKVLLPATKQVPPPAVEAAPAYSAPASRGRVMVVDDEPFVSKSVRRILSSEQDVIEMNNAKDALRLLGSGARFDVILCDLMMPHMTGMEFFEELSQLAPELKSRVVFMSGGAFTSRALDFLAGVPNRTIEKPFEAGPLRELVREVRDGGRG